MNTGNQTFNEQADYIAQVHSRGGRITTAKKLAISILSQAEGHLTAENLCDSMRPSIPKINLSTIYRILEELESYGLVSHTHFGHGPATYEIKAIEHIHLICQICDAEESVSQTLFKNVGKELLLKFGFKTDLSHFAIPGICKNCRSKSIVN
jgi:Fur family ferric uptake transcriptional regulator